MWVEMLVDQIKGGGIYLRGQRLDLPDRIVDLFDEGSYKDTCAPWDSQMPPEQLRLRDAEAKVKALDGEADTIASNLKQARDKVDELQKQQQVLAEKVQDAVDDLEQAQEAVQKIADEAAAKTAAEPVPPPLEELGEAELPKAAEPEQQDKTDGTKKTEGQKPKRQPPAKKH